MRPYILAALALFLFSLTAEARCRHGHRGQRCGGCHERHGLLHRR